jgi:hypothetical protein
VKKCKIREEEKKQEKKNSHTKHIVKKKPKTLSKQ